MESTTSITPIKAVLSDAGYIIFDDRVVKSREYDWVVGNSKLAQPSTPMDPKQFSYREFMSGYYPYKKMAQIHQRFSKDDAFRAYCVKKLNKPDLMEGYAEYSKRFRTWQKEKANELVFDDVPDALEKIVTERKKDFIILTDGTRSAEQAREDFYDHLDICKYFTDILASSDPEVKAKKPSAKFFEHALTKYGLTKEEVIFIAHDLDELKGAAELGIKVVALRYKQSERAAGDLDFVTQTGGYFIESFSDLLDLPELRELCC